MIRAVYANHSRLDLPRASVVKRDLIRGGKKHKRKSHPAKGGFFFQGRIVPTEAKP